MDNDQSILSGLGMDTSTASELGGYNGLGSPAASPSASAENGQSPVRSVIPGDNGEDEGLFPHITHVHSANIKVEPLEDNVNPEEVSTVVLVYLVTNVLKHRRGMTF